METRLNFRPEMPTVQRSVELEVNRAKVRRSHDAPM